MTEQSQQNRARNTDQPSSAQAAPAQLGAIAAAPGAQHARAPGAGTSVSAAPQQQGAQTQRPRFTDWASI